MTAPASDGGEAVAAGAATRAAWVRRLVRVAGPVLGALERRELRRSLPVESPSGAAGERARYSWFEAAGRTLAGVAPWLALRGLEGPEEATRSAWAAAAPSWVAALADPDSPDRAPWETGGQPLVDAAFLCQALLRAPEVLVDGLSPELRGRLADGLRATRRTRPAFNNWLLFSAMVEAGLRRLGAGDWDVVRVDYALRQHEQWYAGDGAYGDGPRFHWDYYNSFVIHPFLLDLASALEGEAVVEGLPARVEPRASRYAAVLERLVAPDGSFPVLGRSMAYRCGAFHLLARQASVGVLPPGLTPGRARCALERVIARTLDAPGTFDEAGWLRIGLSGHQPGLAEGYISTGSLYLCATAFLPLGLAPSAPFWTAPAEPTTGELAWGGCDLPADHAL